MILRGQFSLTYSDKMRTCLRLQRVKCTAMLSCCMSLTSEETDMNVVIKSSDLCTMSHIHILAHGVLVTRPDLRHSIHSLVTPSFQCWQISSRSNAEKQTAQADLKRIKLLSAISLSPGHKPNMLATKWCPLKTEGYGTMWATTGVFWGNFSGYKGQICVPECI